MDEDELTPDLDGGLTPDLDGDVDLTGALGDDADTDSSDAGSTSSKRAKKTPKRTAAPDSDDSDDDDDALTAYGISERSLRSLVRRVAKLTVSFSEADPATVQCAGMALGLRGEFDAASLTVAVITGETRVARALIRDMLEADVSNLQSAILLSGKIAQDRDAAIRWWNVASEIGVVSGNMPRQNPQAAVELVSGLAGLTDEQRATLSASADLLAWRR